MAHIIIKHEVRDYSQWKPAFDAHAEVRESNGCKSGMLFRNHGNPNEIIILFEWDSFENARKFIESDDLRDAMKIAGVEGAPEFYYMDVAQSLAL